MNYWFSCWRTDRSCWWRTTVVLIMAYQFERKIWKKIREAINKESKRQPTTADEIEHYSK